MFQCEKCGKENARYEYPTQPGGPGKDVCPDCGHVKEYPPKESRCMFCGKPYIERTWFDPSGCGHCCRSFVD